MAKVLVKFLPRVREVVGVKEIEVTIGDGETLRTMLDHFESEIWGSFSRASL